MTTHFKVDRETNYHFDQAGPSTALARVPVQTPLLVEKLSLAEEQMLYRCEDQVRRGIESAIEAGEALNTIRDKRLYRAEFRTFEDYCASRWKMTGRRARQLSDFFAVRRTIQSAIPEYDLAVGPPAETSPAPAVLLPENERVVRKLAGKPEAEQVRIWKEAVKSAPDGKVTAKHVEQVIQKKEQKGTKAEQTTMAIAVDVPALIKAAATAVRTLQDAYGATSIQHAWCERCIELLTQMEDRLDYDLKTVGRHGKGNAEHTVPAAQEFVVCREPSKGSVVTKPRYRTHGGWTTDPDKAVRYPSATAAKLADRYGRPMSLEKAQRRFKNSL